MYVQLARVMVWYSPRSWLRHFLPHAFLWGGSLLLCCLWTLCTIPSVLAQQRPREEASAPRQVKVTPAAQKPLERTTVAFGSLAAFDQATVSVKVPGRLQSITVDLGSVVRRGQTIVQIDPQDYQLRVQQAEAALAQARTRLGLPSAGSKDAKDQVDPEQTNTVRQARVLADEARNNRDRLKTLFEQGVIARAQLDTAEASYKVALTRLDEAREEIHNRLAVLAQRRSEFEIARQQLTDTTITAPFDGAIQEKRASVGEYLGAGAPLATIVRMNPLRLRAEVPEREAPQIRVGQKVRVTTEGDNTVHDGHIARLSPTITPQNRMLVVEAEVANSSSALRPGSFARAEIVTDDHSMSLTVPTRAILTFAGVEKVLVVKDGKTVEKPITIRRRTTEWAEVVSGINAGELVVLEPGNMQSGQTVTVAE